jgi:hemolysin III
VSDSQQAVIETRGEYIADAIVHALGVSAALVGVIALNVLAPETISLASRIALIVYSIGLLMTFGFSAAYNTTTHADIKAILRRLDHGAIFLMIAGTYTPISLIGIGGTLGIGLAVSVWVIAVIGVVIKLFFPLSNRWLSIALYLGQSWLALIAIIPIYKALSTYAFAVMVGGGLVYTSGVLIYRQKAWPFNRAIWHGFVLTAAALHYTMVLDVVGIM